RGDACDRKGEFRESSTGKSAVRSGQYEGKYRWPGAPKPAPAKSGGWFGLGGASTAPKAPAKLIEVELQMDKKDDPRGSVLHVTVVIRAFRGAPPRNLEWTDLCNQIFKDLRAYFITKC